MSAQNMQDEESKISEPFPVWGPEEDGVQYQSQEVNVTIPRPAAENELQQIAANIRAIRERCYAVFTNFRTSLPVNQRASLCCQWKRNTDVAEDGVNMHAVMTLRHQV